MVPPFVGVAVNVTEAPVHILLVEATILTDGVTCAGTFIVMLLLVALGVVAQAELLVRIQLTTSPFTRVVEVKVALLVPTLLLLSCH